MKKTCRGIYRDMSYFNKNEKEITFCLYRKQ